MVYEIIHILGRISSPKKTLNDQGFFHCSPEQRPNETLTCHEILIGSLGFASLMSGKGKTYSPNGGLMVIYHGRK